MTQSTDIKKGWYTEHRIPKRSGGYRLLEEPADWLKKVQKDIQMKVLTRYSASDIAYGSVVGRSIADAANIHVASKVKLKMDIKDFFHSVTAEMIKKALLRHRGMSEEDANTISFMCTNAAGVLPQGACTSPYLANIVSSRMCRVLHKVATAMDLKVTIYVDDIIVSGDAPEKMIPLVEKICARYGFTIKKSKTAIMTHKQEILGICATPDKSHARLKKPVRRKLRGDLYTIKKSLTAGKHVSEKRIKKVLGMVSFAHMVGDQSSEIFTTWANEIRALIKEKRA